MDINKALAEVSGTKLIDGVTTRLRSVFGEIIIVTNQPELYSSYHESGVVVTTDIIPSRGPLSGIHAGLERCAGAGIVAVACDMPFLSVGLIEFMITRAEGKDAVVPRIGEYYQPLCALYRRTCLPVLEQALLLGQRKISEVYRQLDIRYVEEDEIKMFGDPEVIFYNVNTRDDLQRAEFLARTVVPFEKQT